MKIKKYKATSLKEASQLMKDELGGEAIILSTKLIEADHSIGRKKMFEITAGIEESITDAKEVKNYKTKLEVNPGKSFVNEMERLSERVYHKSKNSSAVNNSSDVENAASFPEEPARLNGEVSLIRDKLIHNEIQDTLTSYIMEQIEQSREVLTPSNVDDYVISSIASMINTTDFELAKRDEPQVISFVGPTGVGKTTCIAKLATISKILHNLDVGIISIDTYRLGAIDQLRIFSEIVNVELLIAYEPEEMPELLEKFKDKDLIFIDTAGRSQKNTEHLLKMKEFIDISKPDYTYLVMSSTSTTKNLFDVADKFQIFDYNSIVFSKIDEAVVYGNVFNVAAKYDKPIIYLTNGQVIPDDIISAEPKFIARMIYEGKIY